MAAPSHTVSGLVQCFTGSAGMPSAAAPAAASLVCADSVANKMICKQGWLLGTWLTAQKDMKATVQEVLQYLTDGVIVPESGA